jgi:hypothetical protein
MAGYTRLTFCLKLEDMPAFGVDHEANRHRPEGRVVIIGLSTPHGQKQILELITPDSDVVFVWIGTPCGTMSRARGIPLTSSSRAHNLCAASS